MNDRGMGMAPKEGKAVEERFNASPHADPVFRRGFLRQRSHLRKLFQFVDAVGCGIQIRGEVGPGLVAPHVAAAAPSLARRHIVNDAVHRHIGWFAVFTVESGKLFRGKRLHEPHLFRWLHLHKIQGTLRLRLRRRVGAVLDCLNEGLKLPATLPRVLGHVKAITDPASRSGFPEDALGLQRETIAIRVALVRHHSHNHLNFRIGEHGGLSDEHQRIPGISRAFAFL